MADLVKSVSACDLYAGYEALRGDIDSAVLRVLKSGWYILGREVAAFEEEFATFMGVPHAVGVANGTDALHLALRGCGVGPGDAAITVSHTAVATVAAIEMAGVTPVLVDVESSSFTISTSSIEQALTCSGLLRSRIKAIIPVHLYGHPADMVAIRGIADKHGLRVIEDCSQSHGATIDGQMTGTFGDAAIYSLYPTKNLGAMGDAGILTTADGGLADRVRMLRQYGWKTRNDSEVSGVNSRLDEIQAAILRVKLSHLRSMNAARQRIAAMYDLLLGESTVRLPVTASNVEHVFHQYVIRDTDRDALQESLKACGIQTAVHYPVPVHMQTAYKGRLDQPVGLPATEQLASEILSLPMYPTLPDAAVRYVADTICRLRPKQSLEC